MQEPVLLKCGCVASAVATRVKGQVFDPPIPVCSTHDCIEPVDDKPDLTGRRAKCSYGGAEVDSNYGLAFFVYQGPGSPLAINTCLCGFYKSAHTREKQERNAEICHNFTPQGPAKFDCYYCGCQGWD